jgi:hypothetical protein
MGAMPLRPRHLSDKTADKMDRRWYFLTILYLPRLRANARWLLAKPLGITPGSSVRMGQGVGLNGHSAHYTYTGM